MGFFFVIVIIIIIIIIAIATATLCIFFASLIVDNKNEKEGRMDLHSDQRLIRRSLSMNKLAGEGSERIGKRNHIDHVEIRDVE